MLPPYRVDQPELSRIHNCLLGGKDHYLLDEAVAAALLAVDPHHARAATGVRAFAHRAATHLAEQGVDQFLELGSGMPHAPDLHTVIRQVNPDARVVYVDNDALAAVHARALFGCGTDPALEVVQADATAPAEVLKAEELTSVLDLHRPVALCATGLLHFLTDDDSLQTMVSGYLDALAPGSYLLLTHLSADLSPRTVPAVVEVYRAAGIAVQPRSLRELENAVRHLKVLNPGIVPIGRWQPEAPAENQRSPAANTAGVRSLTTARDAALPHYALVASKPADDHQR